MIRFVLFALILRHCDFRQMCFALLLQDGIRLRRHPDTSSQSLSGLYSFIDAAIREVFSSRLR